MYKINSSILFFALSFIFTSQVLSQIPSLDWAYGTGANDYDFSYSVDVDVSGDIYSTGMFRETVDFDPGPGVINLSSLPGNQDGYIRKMDPNGNVIWVKQITGSHEVVCESIHIDGSGNIYVAGSFDGTVDFDPGSGTTNLTSNGSYDIYILKLDPNGDFLWAKSVGGSDIDHSKSITTDNSGNVLLTGEFRSTVDFDPGAGVNNITANGSQYDIYILKLDPNGNFTWVNSMGSISNDQPGEIVTDPTGNIYTVGYFTGTVDFDPGAGSNNLTSNGSRDIYIQKLDPNGDLTWVHQIGAAGQDGATSIDLDPSGNILITGYFSQVVDFNPSFVNSHLVSSGLNDGFVLKLDAAGDYQWAWKFGASGLERGFNVRTDANGNVYSVGEFEGTVDFNPSGGTNNLTSAGQSDIFVHKRDPDGLHLWVVGFEGNDNDFVRGLSIYDEMVYVTGWFNGTVDYDPELGTEFISSNGDTDGYIAKLNGCFSTPPVPDMTNLPDINVECSASPTPPTATGNCVGTISGTPSVSLPVSSQGTTIVTWTYDDGDGNIVTQNQNIIVNDITNPVPDLSSLPTLSGECPITPSAPTASDNCSGSITGTTNTTFPITTIGTTTINWTFDDGNGNIITQNQDVVITDNTPPTASNPSPISVCPGNVPAPDISVVTDETDNCSPPIVSFVSDMTNGNSCPEIITRTYAVTDVGGNSINVTQTITVEDVTAPVATSSTLPNENYECIANPSIPTALDNCSGLINGIPDVSLPISSSGVTTINWTYTDGCGNTSSQTQQISVSNIDNSVSISGITLSANATGYQYQWVNCDNNFIGIAGETNQSFTPNSNGEYAVVLTGLTCSDTSTCFLIDDVKLKEYNALNFEVYPNPSDQYINISFDNKEAIGADFYISDLLGKVVFKDKIKGILTKVDTKYLPVGMYILHIQNGNDFYKKRFIKN